MSGGVGALESRLTLNNQGWVQRWVESGKVTEAEGARIARRVKNIEGYLADLARGHKAANDAAVAQGAATARAMASSVQAGQAAEYSAKQILRANQMLPMQLNDIWVSLASGQNPLMVLIQQGAQIRDMYGGVGAALRQVAGFFSPVTLAAGVGATALAAWAYEAYNGATAARELQKGLALTGNFAGLTEDRVRSLTASLAAMPGGRMLGSRDIVTELAKTGVVGPEIIEPAAKAMQSYMRLTDETADKAVVNFAKISSGATKWAVEQNRQVNFLTLELYKQAAALEDNGRKQEADKVILDGYTKALQERHLPQMGYIGTAWKFWGDQIDRVRSALQNWGGDKSLGDQIAAAEKRLKLAQEVLATAQKAEERGIRMARPIEDKQSDVAQAQAELDQLRARAGLQEAGAKAAAEIARREKEAVEKEDEARKKRQRDAEKARNEERQRILDMFRQDKEDEVAAKKRYADEEMRQAVDLAREREAELARIREEATGKWLLDSTDQAKRQQQLVTKQLQGVEDAIINFGKTGKLSFEDLWAFMAEEYLRNMLRMAAAKNLLDSSGNFIGFGATLGKIGSFLGGIFGGATPLASGMEYVPYDGFPAVLHEGERVQTRAEAARDRAGGAGTVIDMRGQVLNVGSGVSRPEFAAVLARNNAMVEARMRRLSTMGAI